MSYMSEIWDIQWNKTPDMQYIMFTFERSAALLWRNAGTTDRQERKYVLWNSALWQNAFQNYHFRWFLN
jgi:hypothetical protein